MKHLAPEQLVDAAEGTLQDAAAIAHLVSCQLCREQADQFAELETALRSERIPEPSPLFWDRLTERVRTGIDAEPASATSGWRWPVLVPLGGLVLIIVAVTVGLMSGNAVPANDAALRLLAESDAADDAVLEDSWTLMSDLVASLDDDAAGAAGLTPPPGSAERAALDLSAAEHEELVRLLRQEIGETGG